MHQSSDTEVKTSTGRIVGTGLALILFLFVAGGAWAAFTNLSGAVIATGQVVVLGKPKTVQHLDGGIVDRIRVDDGDRVEKGDLLIRLDDTLLKANLKIYENRLREGVAQRARLVAERDELNAVRWDDGILELLEVDIIPAVKTGQRKLFEARRITREGQISQLREKVHQFENQIAGMEALKTSKRTQLGFLDQELDSIRTLNEKGLSPKSQLMALERQREDIIGQIAERDAELARIQNAISETEIQILQIEREFRQTVLTELRQVEQEVNDMTQQLHATLEQLSRVEITAPVAGIVHELSVFTIGGVIGPGDPVLQLIPQDGHFEIEANVEPQFVDEIHAGQLSKLRFSAFNQRTTPEIDGSVKTVSPNVVVNEQTGQSFYKVRIAIPETELARLNGHTLISGMPVEAFIRTKDRTALNYLTKPLMDQINRAFREE
ncbi:HlyD family type I secretion periplasmic adaptor subunit [Roseibium sp. Sym1]|uniref:HlyD family type I secretion periplasmic adaptor subunit n=1 Tax=Roseibium sp. Sym1 TaxID=3016006 RepID=UPI0022B334C1|nr:HlyD family type I secretion periplasmic adaptor subunit [Roseibium sp. Sym1]